MPTRPNPPRSAPSRTRRTIFTAVCVLVALALAASAPNVLAPWIPINIEGVADPDRDAVDLRPRGGRRPALRRMHRVLGTAPGAVLAAGSVRRPRRTGRCSRHRPIHRMVIPGRGGLAPARAAHLPVPTAAAVAARPEQPGRPLTRGRSHHHRRAGSPRNPGVAHNSLTPQGRSPETASGPPPPNTCCCWHSVEF